MKKEGFQVVEIPIIYYKNTSLERAIDRLYVEVDRAYRDGANIIILSDRGVDVGCISNAEAPGTYQEENECSVDHRIRRTKRST